MSNGTIVMKVDPDTMTAQYAWDITIDHHKYGEMFIARGVLYAVHSVIDATMNIRYRKILSYFTTQFNVFAFDAYDYLTFHLSFKIFL
jgi:hypothetical protein